MSSSDSSDSSFFSSFFSSAVGEHHSKHCPKNSSRLSQEPQATINLEYQPPLPPTHSSDLHLPAAGAEPAAGAAEPGAAETATAPPAGTLASLPTPTQNRKNMRPEPRPCEGSYHTSRTTAHLKPLPPAFTPNTKQLCIHLGTSNTIEDFFPHILIH
jgi:hypothetical protein